MEDLKLNPEGGDCLHEFFNITHKEGKLLDCKLEKRVRNAIEAGDKTGIYADRNTILRRCLPVAKTVNEVAYIAFQLGRLDRRNEERNEQQEMKKAISPIIKKIMAITQHQEKNQKEQGEQNLN